MAIVKALDVLSGYIGGWRTGMTYWNAKSVAKHHPNQDCKRNADQCAETAEVLERIAGLVRAAQAWQKAHAALGAILLPVHTDEEADQANAALALDAETTLALAAAVAALDAEEGQTAAPQEGEHS